MSLLCMRHGCLSTIAGLSGTGEGSSVGLCGHHMTKELEAKCEELAAAEEKLSEHQARIRRQRRELARLEKSGRAMRAALEKIVQVARYSNNECFADDPDARRITSLAEEALKRGTT